jgi:hypothetical protein
MDISQISPVSWIDSHLEVRPSSIHGRGVFTTEKIAAGEVLMIWGGALFSLAEVYAGKAEAHSFAAIFEGVFLGHPAGQGNSTDDFVNHSCDPNVWMLDEVTVAACREIAAGEEITADLVIWWDPDEAGVTWECCCGAPNCRKIFTSRDWRRPELQEKYRGHFVPYISQRIEALRRAESSFQLNSTYQLPVDV